MSSITEIREVGGVHSWHCKMAKCMLTLHIQTLPHITKFFQAMRDNSAKAIGHWKPHHPQSACCCKLHLGLQTFHELLPRIVDCWIFSGILISNSQTCFLWGQPMTCLQIAVRIQLDVRCKCFQNMRKMWRKQSLCTLRWHVYKERFICCFNCIILVKPKSLCTVTLG